MLRQRPASAKPYLYGSGKSTSEDLNLVGSGASWRRPESAPRKSNTRPVSAPRKAIETAASIDLQPPKQLEALEANTERTPAWEEILETRGTEDAAANRKLEISSFDWAAVVHAEQEIFKSDALKLETALAELDSCELGHPGSGAKTALTALDSSPKPFRTAVCCRILMVLADSMGKYRHLYKRIASEMMNSIYADYVHPSKENVRPVSNTKGQAKEKQKKMYKHQAAHGSEEEEPPQADVDGVKGFRFDLEPYYLKVPSLEEEVRLLRREKEDFQQQISQLQKKIEDMEAHIASMSRDKDMHELEKQIAVVQLRRANEEQDRHDLQVLKVRKDAKEEILIAQERTERLQIELSKLRLDTAKMVPVLFVEAARNDVVEVWEMLQETRKETLVALQRRRERIDMSQFVGANEQNLGLLFDDEQREEELSDFTLKMFLQRWVGYRMDRWYRQAEQSANERDVPIRRREVLPFGWAWRECTAMIDLLRGIFRLMSSPFDMSDTDILTLVEPLPFQKQCPGLTRAMMLPACFPNAFEDADDPPEEQLIPERAKLIALEVEKISGMRLIAPIELQSGNEGSITLIAAFLFTTFPTLDSVSNEFDQDIRKQREKVAEIDSMIARLEELEKKIHESEKNQKNRQIGELKDDEKDSARTFISVLWRLQPILQEAEAQQKDLRAALDRDRQLWSSVFTRCGNFCFRNIVRKAATAESALERERELTTQMQTTLAKKSRRFTQEAAVDIFLQMTLCLSAAAEKCKQKCRQRTSTGRNETAPGGTSGLGGGDLRTGRSTNLKTGRSMLSARSSRSKDSRSGSSEEDDGLLTNRSGMSMMSEMSGAMSHRSNISSANQSPVRGVRPGSALNSLRSNGQPLSSMGSFRSTASSATNMSRTSRRTSSKSMIPSSPMAGSVGGTSVSGKASMKNVLSPSMSMKSSTKASSSKKQGSVGRKGSMAKMGTKSPVLEIFEV